MIKTFFYKKVSPAPLSLYPLSRPPLSHPTPAHPPLHSMNFNFTFNEVPVEGFDVRLIVVPRPRAPVDDLDEVLVRGARRARIVYSDSESESEDEPQVGVRRKRRVENSDDEPRRCARRIERLPSVGQFRRHIRKPEDDKLISDMGVYITETLVREGVERSDALRGQIIKRVKFEQGLRRKRGEFVRAQGGMCSVDAMSQFDYDESFARSCFQHEEGDSMRALNEKHEEERRIASEQFLKRIEEREKNHPPDVCAPFGLSANAGTDKYFYKCFNLNPYLKKNQDKWRALNFEEQLWYKSELAMARAGEV
jgi:hypothetical protein